MVRKQNTKATKKIFAVTLKKHGATVALFPPSNPPPVQRPHQQREVRTPMPNQWLVPPYPSALAPRKSSYFSAQTARLCVFFFRVHELAPVHDLDAENQGVSVPTDREMKQEAYTATNIFSLKSTPETKMMLDGGGGCGVE